MADLSFGQKVAWFLYQKGMGVAKPEFLFATKTGDENWFKIADVLIKDNHLEGRNLVLDQLLQIKNFRGHPKRTHFLRLLGRFMSKGILDERRRVVQYISDNPGLFPATEDVIMGPLITAQRDSDTVTATLAEEALLKIRGEVKRSKDDFR
ncbi:hypothetical protein L0222_10780 [bacterium]|nr:hypothetical protein [bacterium]MCI0603596.1 hypothetical protein [bacterium]